MDHRDPAGFPAAEHPVEGPANRDHVPIIRRRETDWTSAQASRTVQGLLGPNGAGKTTLVRILATLLAPDSGRARIAGVDVQHHPNTVRSLIGLAGQYAAVDETLTGRENLMMVGRLYRLGAQLAKARAEESLERLGLVDAADDR